MLVTGAPKSGKMGVATNTLILLVCFSGALIAPAWCQEGACLKDGRHKRAPSPEPHLKECSLYTENACCSVDDIHDLMAPPASLEKAHWDKCGALSPVCESFLKRVICFHRCSPDAARWPHPQHGSTLKAVPLCHSFCKDWYDACRMDLTCARDWASDPRGQNCTGSCVPYQQMYQHGRDLCESLWGDTFMTVEDEAGGANSEEGGHTCGCLNLSPSDRDAIAALRAHGEDPEELDTTKMGLPQYRAPCPAPASAKPGSALPAQARRTGGSSSINTILRKRSVPLGEGDAEGSGSGFEGRV
ncbi:retbindin isoform X2 [Clupea harengus]|uniref:Retbindin isoform X2 n=1 Tax=Clupea harengus TaxID=7950 RepID=A0A6P8FQP6_CLUHA|nr:retbindin isoform X2 [Clupea harengus]